MSQIFVHDPFWKICSLIWGVQIVPKHVQYKSPESLIGVHNNQIKHCPLLYVCNLDWNGELRFKMVTQLSKAGWSESKCLSLRDPEHVRF